jgi:hypothetical protein
MVRLVFHSHQPFNRRRRSLPNQFFRNLILDTTDPKQPGGIALVGLATGFVVPAFTQEKEEANPFPFGAIQAKPEIVQQLEAINEKWDEAFNKHDAAAVAAFYTANAILVTPVGVSPVGTASRNSSQMCFSVGILPVN